MTYDPQRSQSGTSPHEPDQGTHGSVATQARYQGPPEPGPSGRGGGSHRTAYVALGLAAVVALAGIVTGLVASNNSSTSTASTIAAVHGTGVNLSPPFKATSGSMTATYDYSCTGTSGSHAFAAGLASSNGGGTVKIAFTSGGSKAGVVTIHPTVGKTYRLGGDSACPYKVTVANK